MTKEERKRFSALIEAAQCLFLENLALKLVLDHHAVPNWQKLVDKLMQDEELWGGVQLKFKDLLGHLERVPDASTALDGLLGPLPRSRKPQ